MKIMHEVVLTQIDVKKALAHYIRAQLSINNHSPLTIRYIGELPDEIIATTVQEDVTLGKFDEHMNCIQPHGDTEGKDPLDMLMDRLGAKRVQ